MSNEILNALSEIEHNHFELIHQNSGSWFCLISRGKEKWFSFANSSEEAVKNTIRLVVANA